MTQTSVNRAVMAGVIVLGLVAIAGLVNAQLSLVVANNSQTLYSETFTANLTEDQEVPRTHASSTGQAHFFIRNDGAGIDYTIQASNLTSQVIGMHLHCARVGENGPVVVPLMGTTSSMISTTSSSIQIATSSILASDIQTAGMQCSPNIQTLSHLAQAMREGSMYINIHTSNFPAGEIRGQLMRSLATSTTATSTATSTATTTPPVSTTTPPISTTTPPQATTTLGWFYVFAEPDSYYKIQGDSIRFSGSHFVPGETVTITTEGTSVGAAIANANGNFTSQTFTVPYGVGMRTYTFSGSASQIPFQVRVNVGNSSPWIVLSSYYAGAGSSIGVTGHQFAGNETVTISFNGVNVGTVQTNSTGDFSTTIVVPSGGAGQRAVTARGGTSNMTASQSFSQAF